jgi:hypothetical protein
MVASWCQHFPPNFRQNNIGPAEEMIASWWQYFPANRKKENITTNRSSGGHAVGAKIFLFSAKLQKNHQAKSSSVASWWQDFLANCKKLILE